MWLPGVCVASRSVGGLPGVCVFVCVCVASRSVCVCVCV